MARGAGPAGDAGPCLALISHAAVSRRRVGAAPARGLTPARFHRVRPGRIAGLLDAMAGLAADPCGPVRRRSAATILVGVIALHRVSLAVGAKTRAPPRRGDACKRNAVRWAGCCVTTLTRCEPLRLMPPVVASAGDGAWGEAAGAERAAPVTVPNGFVVGGTSWSLPLLCERRGCGFTVMKMTSTDARAVVGGSCLAVPDLRPS